MFGAAVLQPGSHEFGNCKSEEQLAKSFLCYHVRGEGWSHPYLKRFNLNANYSAAQPLSREK